jgi:hypothetical protein
MTVNAISHLGARLPDTKGNGGSEHDAYASIWRLPCAREPAKPIQ